jgi:hypothetical protein
MDDRGRKNNESVVVQNQECDGEKNSAIRNNSMDPEVAQASSTNTQCKSLDKVAETPRISTRNKKTPSIRGNDFFFGKGKIWPIICVASKCAKYKQQSSRIRPGVKVEPGKYRCAMFHRTFGGGGLFELNSD